MRAMHLRLALLPTVLLLSLFSTTYAANFTFDYGTPTECDDFPVSWTGGSAPFELVLTPLFGTPRTFSVPSSNYTNGQGTFHVQLPFHENQTFMALMSDSNGFGTGGISSILTVGESVSKAGCNTTDPGVDFFFELNDALQQCRPYEFFNYTGAVQPVTIRGAIPGGEAFILNPPTGPVSYDWTADVAAGTSIVWIMTDSQGHQGGSSDVKLVGISDDSSCLSSNSPSSLAAVPSATASASPSSSSGGATPSSTSSSDAAGGTTSKTNTGAIVGGVLAGVVGLGAIAALILFLVRRNRRTSSYYDSNQQQYVYRPRRSGRLRSVDLDAPAVMEDGHPAATINPYPFSAPSVTQSVAGGGSAHELLPRDQESQYRGSQYQGSQYLGTQYDGQSQYGQSQYGQSQYTNNLTNPYSASPSDTSFSQHNRRPSGSTMGGAALSTIEGSMPGGDNASMTSSARRKAAMAGVTTYKPPTRFIVHTDLEEVQPPDDGEEVVELPPQYSEHRAPLRALDDYTAPPEGSPSNTGPLDQEAGSSSRLQEPMQPATPKSPTTPTPRKKS